jgi:hypothetical protein
MTIDYDRAKTGGFAAAQCGKPLAYRRHLLFLFRLRLSLKQ